eukprot:scaffold282641_cov14-Tisochrysis_lutea.AAC.2
MTDAKLKQRLLQSEADTLSADVHRLEQRAAALREKVEQEKQSKQQTVSVTGLRKWERPSCQT